MSELFFLVELFLAEEVVLVFFVASEVPPVLAVVCELLEVVVMVSFLSAQDAKNATPANTAMEERMDLFIGLELTRRDCRATPESARTNHQRCHTLDSK